MLRDLAEEMEELGFVELSWRLPPGSVPEEAINCTDLSLDPPQFTRNQGALRASDRRLGGGHGFLCLRS
jgi:hypothetical protein